jgi:hypothetical protein
LDENQPGEKTESYRIEVEADFNHDTKISVFVNSLTNLPSAQDAAERSSIALLCDTQSSITVCGVYTFLSHAHGMWRLVTARIFIALRVNSYGGNIFKRCRSLFPAREPRWNSCALIRWNVVLASLHRSQTSNMLGRVCRRLSSDCPEERAAQAERFCDYDSQMKSDESGGSHAASHAAPQEDLQPHGELYCFSATPQPLSLYAWHQDPDDIPSANRLSSTLRHV